MSASLLIEIGLEELPPLAMRPLARSLADNLAKQLSASGIQHGAVQYFATPRRLAVHIADTAAASPDEAVEKQGPTVAIAYDEAGNPSKAGLGFARSLGTTIDQLAIEDSDKGRRLVYRGTAQGQPLSQLLQPAVDAALRALPIPKRMRWGNSRAAFVRPVHWVVALHGRQVLPLDIFEATADRYTYGHRFHHPAAIELAHADEYADKLYTPGHVIADIDQRRNAVQRCVTRAAQSLQGQAIVTSALLDEVNALVEWPAGIAGRFDPQYLELPREVLIATLEGHQRYFPIENAQSELMAGFVTVANIDSRDPAQVVAGNERVIRPRLADALFFWEQDRKRSLAERKPDLARVNFQQSLGTLAAKSQRVEQLIGQIAPAAGARTDEAIRAAQLAKTDLLTQMVDEFPELQGIIGGYYAQLEGESQAVIQALPEQYAPSGGGAAIAETATGRSLAMADRLDTLAGIFAINQRPSGDKDPFGLRRAALGVLRTLIEGQIQLDLRQLLETALSLQPVTAPEGTTQALWHFHMERLRHYYTDNGVPAAHYEAIAALPSRDMLNFDQRIQAVGQFMQLPEAGVVCAAHKRIRNILKRNTQVETAPGVVAPEALVENAEKDLYEQLTVVEKQTHEATQKGDYTEALTSLAPLAQPLDDFFTAVMVMSDDPQLQRNRLALLRQVDQTCRQVADISCLSVEIA